MIVDFNSAVCRIRNFGAGFLVASAIFGTVDGIQSGLRTQKCQMPNNNLVSAEIISRARQIGKKTELATAIILLPEFVVGSLVSNVSELSKRPFLEDDINKMPYPCNEK